MKLAFALLSVFALSVSGSAQVEVHIPDNLPAVGTCNVIPFGQSTGTGFQYPTINRVLATSLNPANRKIDAVSFAGCFSGTFSATNIRFGIGHLTAAATIGVQVALPTFDLAGNVATLGVFADYTSLWNSVADGPMSYSYTANAWAPMPQAPATPFIWNGVDNIGVFIAHIGSTGANSFHRSSTEPYRWYSSAGFGATVSTTGSATGLKMRLTCSPHALASVTSVGVGCPGLNAMVPVLSTLQLPSLGNAAFTLTVSNAPGGAASLLYGSLGLNPFPISIGGGCSVYLDPVTLDLLINAAFFPLGPVFADPLGVAGFNLPIPPDPALNGLHVGLQAVIFDASAALGLTLTNALDLELH